MVGKGSRRVIDIKDYNGVVEKEFGYTDRMQLRKTKTNFGFKISDYADKGTKKSINKPELVRK